MMIIRVYKTFFQIVYNYTANGDVFEILKPVNKVRYQGDQSMTIVLIEKTLKMIFDV